MQDFKQKLHNYESTPPKSIWDNIVAELDNAEKKVVQIPSFRRKYRFLFYALIAAASLLIIFVSSLFFEKKSKTPDQQLASSSTNTTDSQANVMANDSLNNKTLKLIIESSKDKSLAGEINNNPTESKKYLTIAGPEGQPVKISSKVATLIVSADNDYPPRPVWDKKINKWKEIMLSSTISPTATNLLDIVQLSSMRGDN
ncbi:MAG: hypothetical protein ABI691_00220 [Ginsengibacter sp.]